MAHADQPDDVTWLAHPYVHVLLDALLDGKPLDFGGNPVPHDVQERLTEAVADGRLKAVEEGEKE